MRFLATAIALSLLSGTAGASTPEAWAELDERVNLACREASGLDQPVVAAVAVRFSDAMPIEARLVRGYTQGSGQQTSQAMLCLYDRRTHKVETQALAGTMLRF